eukprot:TRINITY_DN5658_c0_g2_i1.p1 TRINITY_DN5658_c0_g2~~TRINITY_DN5658_c0_g2_i1.p1  ORF type:complete len:304 (-),score=70.37 TRINITY_DN5658_c0_g2_i1:5-916(-)
MAFFVSATSPVSDPFDADVPGFALVTESNSSRYSQALFGNFITQPGGTTNGSSSSTLQFPLAGWGRLATVNGTQLHVTYRANLTSNGSAQVQLDFQYDQNRTTLVTLPDGEAYTLPKGAIKYSLYISTSHADNLFDGDKSAVLRWSTCFHNNETLGTFDLDAVTTNTRSTVQYTFISNTGAQFRLRVPLIALVDDAVANVTHELYPAPQHLRGSSGLQVCVEWTFPYFATSLAYDPDLSVLTGSTDKGNESGPSHVIEIAVPVAVGGALVLVCVVIVVGVIVVALLSYKRRKTVAAFLASNQS